MTRDAIAASMKIACTSQFSDFIGGGEHSLIDLASHLQPPWQPILVTPAVGALSSKALASDIEVAYLPMPRLGIASLPALWRWLGWCRAERPALLYANNSRAAVYAGIAGRLLGIPMVFHCRIAERDRRLDWLIARLAARVVANSHTTARRFAPRFSDKVETIYNGIGMPSETTTPSKPQGLPAMGDGRMVLCVARVSRWKRHDMVLEAFARLAEADPSLHLAMVGGSDPYDPAWMQELEARSAAMPCSRRIHWLGHRENLSDCYQAADALILASREEPFGRVVVEAMANGVPVVAANAGGPAEIIESGVSGVLVDVDTPEGWAEGLRSVLADGGFREGIIEHGRRRAAKFSLDRHVNRMQSLFALLMEAP